MKPGSRESASLGPPCHACDGHGYVFGIKPNSLNGFTDPCPACRGTGGKPKEPTVGDAALFYRPPKIDPAPTVEAVTTINLGSPDEPFTVKVSRLTIGCAIEWDEPMNGLYIPPEAERLIALAICPELEN